MLQGIVLRHLTTDHAFEKIRARDIDAVVLGIGLGLCWLAARLYYQWPFLRRPRLSAVGTVVGYRDISGEGGSSTLLIIRFEADDGQIIEIDGSLGPWSHEIAKGSTIGVEYPVGFPKRARNAGIALLCPGFVGLCPMLLRSSDAGCLRDQPELPPLLV